MIEKDSIFGIPFVYLDTEQSLDPKWARDIILSSEPIFTVTIDSANIQTQKEEKPDGQNECSK